ncbi:MAG: N-acetylneuraminate synthase [Candidatus Omnitrophota bacterium]|jgi:N,N'-diacetyllegionaminate synthase
MRKVFIIAEAGVNHNGSLKTAIKMVDAAAKAGCDAVKFQTFKAESLACAHAPKAAYQRRSTGRSGSQCDMLKKLELDDRAHKALKRHCAKRGIEFISTPYDEESVSFLCRLGVKTIKVPSGEITNYPYLRKIGGSGKRVILSTGMSDMGEVKRAVRVLAASGTKRGKITVMQCNSEYPTPFRDANILAMLTLKKALNLDAGYSDHTPGIEAPIAAAALGATVIEKHFTLDRNMRGPDHKASLEPGELAAMVRAIRNIEEALGDGVKRPSPSESGNRVIARKSIVAARRIARGEAFCPENLAVKRPGNGMSPMEWDRVIGRKAKRSFKRDELIRL